MILDFFMARIYRNIQRTDQMFHPNLPKSKKTTLKNTQIEKTQILNIPKAKKPQDQLKQNQDTWNWNNDTTWIIKTTYHQKYPKKCECWVII